MIPSLRRHFRDRPGFLAELESAPDRYTMERARDGQFVPVRKDNGEWLASRYQPLKEAERWLASQDLTKEDLPVLLGFMPSMLHAIKDRPLVVVENDRSRAKAVLDGCDLGRSFDGVTLLFDDDGYRLMSAVRNAWDPFRHQRVRVLTPPYVNDIAWVRGIADGALKIQRENTLNFLSYASQLPKWLETVMANLDAYVESPDANVLMQCLKGETAIIVAAGPSLMRNVSELKAVRGRAIILAVDTALRTLDAAGVIPDVVVAVDANDANALDVEGLSPEMLAVPLVADQIAAPAIVDAFTGPKAFLRSINYTHDLEARPVMLMQPLDDFIAVVAGRTDIASWQSGGSVSTNAYTLAWEMGCKRIIFVAHDLAFTGGLSHTTGVGYEEQAMSGQGRFGSRETYYRQRLAECECVVDAWDGGKVGTTEVLREYLQWYELTVKHGFGASLELIDATEGGALKYGMKRQRLRDAVAALPAASDVVARFRQALARAPRAVHPGWQDRLRRLAERAEALLKAPDRIGESWPLARWLALPAYIGSCDMPEETRKRIIQAAHLSAANYLVRLLRRKCPS